MSRIPPMYVCPDCEGHKAIMYAGRIIAKVCSACADGHRYARTGADRIEPGIDEAVRRIFGGRR
jgi:hypothetical protein